MLIQKLEKKKLIHPPKWLANNTIYLTLMGSMCYGTNTDESDWDIYGITIPLRDQVFPHLAGEIQGFGTQKKRFNQWSEHHVFDKEENKEYDLTVYNIVSYFSLLMGMNPNIVDSIWTPDNYILHNTQIGVLIRDNRKLFLNKKLWHTFRGYAASQKHKMLGKNPDNDSKRKALRDKYGWDVKYGMHLCRNLLEAEMLLSEGDMDLQRDKEFLKGIRRGEMTQQEVFDWATAKGFQLEKIYAESKLPWGPDEEKIKTLLLSCLEIQYGSLDKCVVIGNNYEVALQKIEDIIQDLRRKEN